MFNFIKQISITPFNSQKGSIMPMTALALVSIMGIAGLAVDSSHLFISKSKLQNMLDAAALGTAKVLDTTRSQFTARFAAKQIINSNLAQASYKELKDLGLDADDFVIQFSSTRNPFVANPSATNFVRIRLNQGVIEISTLFMSIMGVNELNLSGSAIAGPSPSLGKVCNLIPSIVCGDPNQAPDSLGMYGYSFGDQLTLAMGNTKNNEIGPGNFQLLDLGNSSNGNKLRESLAGGSTACVAMGESVETKPGVNRGPVSQGFNARFGIYSGPISADDYPPDLITDAGANNYPDTYADYQFDKMINNYDEIDGVADRRITAVAFGNCDGTVNGRGNIDVLGFGCVFLTQPAKNNGALQTVQMSGEMIRNCRSSGIPGTDPVGGSGVYTIQLYGDPDSWDS